MTGTLESRHALLGQWVLTAFVCVFVLVLAGWLLASIRSVGVGWRYAAVSGCVIGLELGLLWRHLGRNHPPGGEHPRPWFGPGTILTVIRGLLLGCVAGFLVVVPIADPVLAWVPGVLYGLAVVLDLFDGVVARRTDSVTELGTKLDTNLDAIGLLVAPLVAVVADQLPIWYLAVGGARYAFLAGIYGRRRLGLPVFDLPESTYRRPLATLQMCIVAGALWPIFQPPLNTLVATLAMLPFLAVFARDWLAVCGRW